MIADIINKNLYALQKMLQLPFVLCIIDYNDCTDNFYNSVYHKNTQFERIFLQCTTI